MVNIYNLIILSGISILFYSLFKMSLHHKKTEEQTNSKSKIKNAINKIRQRKNMLSTKKSDLLSSIKVVDEDVKLQDKVELFTEDIVEQTILCEEVITIQTEVDLYEKCYVYFDDIKLPPLKWDHLKFERVAILPYSVIEDKIFLLLAEDNTLHKIERDERKTLIESLYAVPILEQVRNNKSGQYSVYWLEKEKLVILLVGVNKFPYMDKYGFIEYDKLTTNKEYLLDCAKEIEYKELGWDLV